MGHNTEDPGDAVLVGLREVPIIAILRGMPPDRTAERASALIRLGVRLVEVTVQNELGFDALSETMLRCSDMEGLIGAGSVKSARSVDRVLDIGAQFILSPGLSVDIVDEAHAAGAFILPGVATPTEVQWAADLGLDVVKLFPASHLGGPSYIGALHGPFPEMRFVPTGGVSMDNVQSYLDGGAIGAGLGSSLSAPDATNQLEMCISRWTRADST